MILVHGVYHFRPKRLAFRNDYCLYCNGERRAERIRTFDTAYLFWVPILPLGFRTRWYCVECRHDPHENRHARRGLKWSVIAFLLMFAAVSWLEPVSSDFVLGGWLLRIGLPAAALWMLHSVMNTPEDPSIHELLEHVATPADTTCPFCKTPLMVGSTTWCPDCGAERL